MLQRLLQASLIFGLLSGCIRHYEPPTPNQPHAIVKIRRSYETIAGVQLTEHVNVGEFRALEDGGHSREARQARIDAILAHPIPDSFTVSATFSHTENRLVQETYYTQEPYSTSESYSCGFGTTSRTCFRSVTRYRSVPKTRMVVRPQTIVDGSCGRILRFAPAVGRVYLLQFTYQDDGACSLSCYEQIATGAGGFVNQACPAAPPAQN